MAKVPTVADLRARRLEMTRAAVRETLLEDDYEHVRAVVESLSDEFDLVEVALAAVKFAHETTGMGGDEEELPSATFHGDTGGASGPKGRGSRNQKGSLSRRPPAAASARIYVGLGRTAGIRPGDLVGAIAGESSLSGRDIGAIEITQRFSLVEVPETKASEVIDALRRTTIKGRKASVRPDRDAAR